METAIPAIFPVVTYEPNKQVFIGHGTAFFINDNGVFVTAAHTFRDPFRHPYALINGKPMLITRLWSEYTDHGYQRPAIYRDLYFGKVDDVTGNEALTLADDTIIEAGVLMELLGYHQFPDPKARGLEDEEVATIPEATMVAIDLLHHDLLEPDSEIISDDEEKISRLKMHPIEVNYIKPNFKHLDKYVVSDEEFTNGFTIHMDHKDPHGHSGGPILYQSRVVGMLLGQSAAISSAYINDKLVSTAALTPPTPTSKLLVAVPESYENTWLYGVLENVHQMLNIPDSIYAANHEHLCFISSKDLYQLQHDVYAPWEKGFAGALSNYRVNDADHFVHLVVINHDKCRKVNLSRPELEAVIAHEIGHIFNMYEQKKPPTEFDSYITGEPFDAEQAARVKYENRLNNEYYADDYACQQGYLAPMIGSLEKYLYLDDAENREMIDQRISRLKQRPQELIGALKPLRDMPPA